MAIKVKESYDFGSQLSADPLVVVEDAVLSAGECEHIIDLARGRLEAAKVSAAEKGVFSPGRTGSNCWLNHLQSPIVCDVITRISNMVGIPAANAESLQVIHYAESQEYRPHFDAYNTSTERGVRCTAKSGQRMVTALLYLNTVGQGGGTGFPELGIEVPAVEGRILVFHNTLPGTTEVHPLSMHGGQPVTVGEKWACNLWFRERVTQVDRTSNLRLSLD